MASAHNTSFASNDSMASDNDRGEHILVELQRQEGGSFGFNISGGRDVPHIPGHPGIFISRVRHDGPAAQDGRLEVGDLILAVNDIDLTNVDHQTAVDVFRERITSRCQLTVEKGAEKRVLHAPARNLSLEAVEPAMQPKSTPSGRAGTGEGGVPVAVSNSPAPQAAAGKKNGSAMKGSGSSAATTITMSTMAMSSGGSGGNMQQHNSPPSSTATTVGDDGLPRTPKAKRAGFLNPQNPSLMTELFAFTFGAAAIAITGYYIYRHFRRGN